MSMALQVMSTVKCSRFSLQHGDGKNQTCRTTASDRFTTQLVSFSRNVFTVKRNLLFMRATSKHPALLKPPFLNINTSIWLQQSEISALKRKTLKQDLFLTISSLPLVPAQLGSVHL